MLHLVEALRRLLPAFIFFFVAALTYSTCLYAQQGVDVRPNEIGGVVTSSKGPEAGVWVIAETTELPTKFARIVVTDDQGRYLIPDLPTANYSVWVRGYGLVDSAKMRAKPGMILNLAAVIAPNDAAAAHYYPAAYWYALLKDSAGKRLRRIDRYSEKHHAGQLAAANEQRRLRRLSSARSRIDPHNPCGARQI